MLPFSRRSIPAVLVFALASVAGSLPGCDDASTRPEPAPPTPEPLVGTISFAYTDISREEDATDEPDDRREILISAYYPARGGGDFPVAPCYRRSEEADLNAIQEGLPAGSFDTICDGQALEGAEVLGGDPLPLLVFSHGYTMQTPVYTSWLEAIARRGYIVLGVTHPYSAGVTVLPSGVIARTPPPPLDPVGFDALIDKLSMDQRAAVEALRSAQPGTLEAGLAARWDRGAVGYLGHSVGGAASARTCLVDASAAACANLDGPMESRTAAEGLDQPFLLVNATNYFTTDPSRASAWDKLRGPGYRLDLPDALHNNFSDLPLWFERLGAPGDPAQWQIGALEPGRVQEVTLAYLGAFFDRHLRGMETPLLDSPSPYAEATWRLR